MSKTHKEKLDKRICEDLKRLEEKKEPEDYFRRQHREWEITQLNIFKKWNEEAEHGD